MAETFLVDNAKENGTAVVRFIGELDLVDAERAEEAGVAALAGLNGNNGTPLMLDLSELVFCDSSGLKALLSIQSKAEASGHSVTLLKPRRVVRQLLEVTETSPLFVIIE